MAHWRTMVGERTHFDVADLGGHDLTVQIEACREGVVAGMLNGRKTETRVVLVQYVGHPRAHGYKATLCKTMVGLYGTGDVTKWAGKWVTLYAAMVPDPQNRGAMCEAVRIRPTIPTEAEIGAAKLRTPPAKASSPARDEAADRRLVVSVCEAIEQAHTPAEVEAAITPHRDEILAMDRRSKATVSSAKAARIETLKQANSVIHAAPEGDSQ